MVLNFSKQISLSHPSFTGLTVISCLVSVFVAIWCSLWFFFPASISPPPSFENPNPNLSGCNLFKGNWVHDESYPLYNASECGFLEHGFNCAANGRKDKFFLKWRWKPKNCAIPRFDAHEILEKLRGKRVIFVGDSLGRTQWESMICMLMSGVEEKRSVYEINGNMISKQIKFLSVRFKSFDLLIDFYRSVFLVRPGRVPRRAPKRVRMTLKLDELDGISEEWIDSDVLVFNSGHWWTQGKLFKIGCYFQLGGSLKLGMPITTAFRIALKSWASWVDRRIDRSRTNVFFRTFESSHWINQGLCNVTKMPLSNAIETDSKTSFSDALIHAVKNMKVVPVNVLDVTGMTAFRSDAHVGPWTDKPSVSDCSHWCLPGVPDMWNEILFSYLLSKP